MKLIFHSLCLLFMATTVYANTFLNEIKIPDQYKVEEVYSGRTFATNSFHLVVATNKKAKKATYRLFIYHYINDDIVSLKPIDFEDYPELESSFSNNSNLLTLVFMMYSKKSSHLIALAIDLNTGEHSTSNSYTNDNLKAILKQSNKTCFLYSRKDEIKIVELTTQGTKEFIIEPKPSSEVFFSNLSINNVEAFQSDDFTPLGSIKQFRAYYHEDIVTITQDKVERGNTDVLRIPLGEKTKLELDILKVAVNTSDLNNEITSFCHKNKLFQLKCTRDAIEVFITDLNSQKLLSRIDLTNIEPSYKGTSYKSLDKFRRNASRGTYLPTISVNPSVDSSLVIRIDYVDKMRYYSIAFAGFRSPNYFYSHYNGAYLFDYYNFVYVPSLLTQSDTSIEYIIDNNVYSDSQNFNAKEKSLPKDKLEEFEAIVNEKDFALSSEVMTSNFFRYFLYNSKTKSCEILNLGLKDD